MSNVKRQNAKLIVAPRHPERFEKVSQLLEKKGVEFARRGLGGRFGEDRNAMLWDTLGELVTAYAAGDWAFVGGSLVPVGGHNPLEPAGLGLPVLFGPHMFNARDSAECLLSGGGAVQVDSPESIRAVLAEWLADPERAASIGQRARAAVDSRRGVARRTAEAVAEILNERRE